MIRLPKVIDEGRLPYAMALQVGMAGQIAGIVEPDLYPARIAAELALLLGIVAQGMDAPCVEPPLQLRTADQLLLRTKGDPGHPDRSDAGIGLELNPLPPCVPCRPEAQRHAQQDRQHAGESRHTTAQPSSVGCRSWYRVLHRSTYCMHKITGRSLACLPTSWGGP
jgi:hypothetical protein